MLAIDLRCDSKVDEYLPFDKERILSVLVEEAGDARTTTKGSTPTR